MTTHRLAQGMVAYRQPPDYAAEWVRKSRNQSHILGVWNVGSHPMWRPGQQNALHLGYETAINGAANDAASRPPDK